MIRHKLDLKMNLPESSDKLKRKPVEYRPQNLSSGFLMLTAAKIVFTLSGYIIYISLPRLLGSPAEFGRYGIVMSVINIVNMLFLTGILQSVSKLVSEDPDKIPHVRRTAYRVDFTFAAVVVAMFWLAAPTLSGLFREDLTALFRIGGFIPALYAVYGIFIGLLNGCRKFRTQAAFDMSYSIIRASVILAAAGFGFGIRGILFGILIVITLIIIPAWMVTRSGSERHDGSGIPNSRFIQFQISVMALTGLSQLLVTADLFSIKILTPESISAHLAGLYTVTQAFARVPFVVIAASGLFFFPLMSRSTFISDRESTRKIIHQAHHLVTLISMPVACLIAVQATGLLGSIYPPPYSTAAPALEILSIGSIFYALMYLYNTLITSSGHPDRAIVFMISALIVQITGSLLLVPHYGIKGAAWASLIGWASGSIISGFYLLRVFGRFTSTLEMIRIAGCTAAAMVLTATLPGSGLWAILFHFLFFGVLYLGLITSFGLIDWSATATRISGRQYRISQPGASMSSKDQNQESGPAAEDSCTQDPIEE